MYFRDIIHSTRKQSKADEEHAPITMRWQTSKPEGFSTAVDVDLERGNSGFYVLRSGSANTPKWQHLKGGERQRMSRSNYETCKTPQ